MTFAFSESACRAGCCRVLLRRGRPAGYTGYAPHRRKAGAVVVDTATDRVLLVQSYGGKWGPPKGSIEPADDNSLKQCALREVREETGLDLLGVPLSRTLSMARTVFFVVDVSTAVENDQGQKQLDIDAALDRVLANPGIVCSEITGIGWLRPQCVRAATGTSDSNDARKPAFEACFPINISCGQLLKKLEQHKLFA